MKGPVEEVVDELILRDWQHAILVIDSFARLQNTSVEHLRILVAWPTVMLAGLVGVVTVVESTQSIGEDAVSDLGLAPSCIVDSPLGHSNSRQWSALC